MRQKKVRKAIIPAAGFGTRMFPASKTFKKEFFPIVDQDGLAKPVILLIVEEALSAGIEEIGIIIQNRDKSLFEDFFKTPPIPQLFKKLSLTNRQYSQYLQEIGMRITLLFQEEQEGYGHAVYCTQDWINNEPFLLLLGDHIYRSNTEFSCAKQLIDVYQKFSQSTIGLTIMPEEIIHKAGIVTGNWQERNSLLKITQLSEKPDLDYARSHLHILGMKDNEFMAIFGMYILEPEIFDYLGQEIRGNLRYKQEFQLTTCLDKLTQDRGMIGYQIQGQYFDIGMPEFYRQTIIDYP
ncbi:MAG TPA: UTP--glucose-1-phosphate uridylyltransferase [Cyanothece sp. UBA12306]|nr:UTP--glucose-1-phosphate uridylyltransferase [Cyanothece sp. UBA12306]